MHYWSSVSYSEIANLILLDALCARKRSIGDKMMNQFCLIGACIFIFQANGCMRYRAVVLSHNNGCMRYCAIVLSHNNGCMRYRAIVLSHKTIDCLH